MSVRETVRMCIHPPTIVLESLKTFSEKKIFFIFNHFSSVPETFLLRKLAAQKLGTSFPAQFENYSSPVNIH